MLRERLVEVSRHCHSGAFWIRMSLEEFRSASKSLKNLQFDNKKTWSKNKFFVVGYIKQQCGHNMSLRCNTSIPTAHSKPGWFFFFFAPKHKVFYERDIHKLSVEWADVVNDYDDYNEGRWQIEEIRIQTSIGFCMWSVKCKYGEVYQLCRTERYCRDHRVQNSC